MTGERHWYFVRIRPRDRAAVAEALFREGVGAVQETDDELRTHVPADWDIASLCAAIERSDPGARIDHELAPEVDWTEEWKHGVGAHALGRLTIAPPWLAAATPRESTIVIDPGTAFGTGEHATTRGVVRLLQQVLTPSDRVADLGAGSAVLSIAAVRLGAAWVAAIEIDPEAIDNAEANVRANDVAERVRVLQGDASLLLPIIAPVDLVVANIVSPVLAELLPLIGNSLADRGRAVLSGILVEERDAFCDLLDGDGWTVIAEDSEDIWWSVAVAR